MSQETECVRPPCPVRTGEVRGVRADNFTGVFALAFPRLPEGAIPVEINVEFEDHESHYPTGYVLHYEVPDPEGKSFCGSGGCPRCDPETP